VLTLTEATKGLCAHTHRGHKRFVCSHSQRPHRQTDSASTHLPLHCVCCLSLPATGLVPVYVSHVQTAQVSTHLPQTGSTNTHLPLGSSPCMLATYLSSGLRVRCPGVFEISRAKSSVPKVLCPKLRDQ